MSADVDSAIRIASRVYRFVARHGLLAPPLAGMGAARHLLQLPGYVRDWRTYSGMPGAEALALVDSYPVLNERTLTTGVERHYFHLANWASRRIAESGVDHHVDVGSDHRMWGVLAAFVRVTFIDFRPLAVGVDGLQPVAGDILQLPFASNSVQSLSCLHAAEHIGLGRYGDPLNPHGTRDAAKELTRVLARGGSLYFALPIGRARVEFNAHRVHTPSQILSYFGTLKLVGFAVEDDELRFHANANPADFEQSDYACGMFWFCKPN